jgi:hypothetical protein
MNIKIPTKTGNANCRFFYFVHETFCTCTYIIQKSYIMVVVYKDRIVLEYFENGNKVDKELGPETESVCKYLDRFVHIEEDVTVGDFFALLAREPETMDLVFDCSLGGHSFSEFIEESLSEPEPEPMFRYAIFEHICNIETGELLHEVRFNIFGLHPEDESLVEYSVELVPMNTYLHLGLSIDTIFSVSKFGDTEEDDILLFEVNKPMTVYEVVSALLFEISYYGNAEGRSAVMDEYMDEIMRLVEDGDHDIALLEQELDRSISMEDYETSAKIRDKINDLKRNRSNKKIQDGRKE